MSKKLFIGNLSFQATSESLKEHFEGAGAVDNVKIVTDRMSGRSKGFGFVEMVDEASAQKAIEAFNGKEFLGRPLTVSVANPETPRPGGGGPRPGGFRGDRGGYGGGGGQGGGGGRGGFGGGGGGGGFRGGGGGRGR
jgi:RNA recognition motif-containing protein